jgi:hypothetical protein
LVGLFGGGFVAVSVGVASSGFDAGASGGVCPTSHALLFPFRTGICLASWAAGQRAEQVNHGDDADLDEQNNFEGVHSMASSGGIASETTSSRAWVGAKGLRQEILGATN